jgi:hypothetical protein
MVRDARRRAPHHEDLILRSPLSRQRTCAVRSGVSKDEVIQVGIEVQNIEEVSARSVRHALRVRASQAMIIGMTSGNLVTAQ